MPFCIRNQRSPNWRVDIFFGFPSWNRQGVPQWHEFERELIRARTGEGRKRAKDRGVKFGCPPKLTSHSQETASFARLLPPKRGGLGPGQSDFGRIDISTVIDALGSMQWDVDDCPVSMELKQSAAVDGP
jgi:hypothetical protein